MATNSNAGGKGSGARPMEISRDQFAKNFDAIFRKKKPNPEGGKELENIGPGANGPVYKGKEPPEGDPAFESR